MKHFFICPMKFSAALLGVYVALNTSCMASILEIPGCAPGIATETNGVRRLAVVIGVGQYKNDSIPDLEGPPNDARRVYEVLTGKNGYGFPKENVCMLLDEQATVENLRQAFAEHLLKKAKDKDVVVFYYAGHGSETPDKNGDEPDGQDETMVLHDSRTEENGKKIGDLVDDEFNTLLAGVYRKTPNVTVLLDSCNSGTATRGDQETMIARFVEPAADPPEQKADSTGDGAKDWLPESMPGMIAFTAASDGTSALEQHGRGVFTDAVIQVVAQGYDKPLTYAQAARQIPALVAARSYQVPYFQGDLNKPVFGNAARAGTMAWEITDLGPPLKLAGPPLPGLGQGAELRIYDGALSGSATKDPAKAKATVVLEEMNGLTATAKLAVARPGTDKPALGDLAVLVRPADDYVRISVRIKKPGEPGGVPAERAAAVQQAVQEDAEAKLLVNLTNGPGDFELSVNQDGLLQLKGPENRIRDNYAKDADVALSLWQHARQKGLLQLQGEGGSEFKDNQTLQVELSPQAKQDICAKGVWQQAAKNEDQIMPLCYRWNVKVTLSKDATSDLLIGGVVLSTDGSTFGFPADGRKLLLKPGASTVFNAPGETFRAGLPIDVWDHLIVFGTKEKNPVRWDLLTQSVKTRGVEPVKTGLYRALDQYLKPGTRGQSSTADSDASEDSTWTLSKINMRVEANARFQQVKATFKSSTQSREYTIKHFDIRPYLPDDQNSALYKVLQKADWLAQSSAGDGFSYKQHDWSLNSDQKNLRKGVDCSRAIWFAFTRAGLPYNSGDRFLNTAQMVSENNPMHEQFERCDNDQPSLGDLLVYRDASAGDGHVVMVIDSLKRIAWGSHGYDGSAKELKIKPDTGVEYQLIKYKKDWERWDRKSMKQVACWRYKKFADEVRTTRGLPGIKAIATVCDIKTHCGS